MTRRLDGVTALRGFLGHRAMTEPSMASIDEELAQRKRPVERLESAPA